MDDKGNGAYEMKIQLKYDDSTKIKYHFVINVQNYPGVEWTESETTQVDLDTSMTRAYDGETDNNNDGSDGTSGTPGFELILVFCALAFILFLRRKRQ